MEHNFSYKVEVLKPTSASAFSSKLARDYLALSDLPVNAKSTSHKFNIK